MRSLREVRESRGLSQVELAARASVGERTVQRTELGATRPSPRVARRLADALGVAPDAVRELRSAVPRLPQGLGGPLVALGQATAWAAVTFA
ncbi:MAG: helix-turn-helix protein [Thermomicrobiales bacterium]|jgi:transcriptional regulator with XRE-family HTH domain|nr:helix-turn-helix protein [Thermomicrobiales bacterium]MEA2582105.1 helix-turn-helix protein [Thermomicrobiales bacterium]